MDVIFTGVVYATLPVVLICGSIMTAIWIQIRSE